MGYVCAWVCARACVCACVRVCVCNISIEVKLVLLDSTVSRHFWWHWISRLVQGAVDGSTANEATHQLGGYRDWSSRSNLNITKVPLQFLADFPSLSERPPAKPTTGMSMFFNLLCAVVAAWYLRCWTVVASWRSYGCQISTFATGQGRGQLLFYCACVCASGYHFCWTSELLSQLRFSSWQVYCCWILHVRCIPTSQFEQQFQASVYIYVLMPQKEGGAGWLRTTVFVSLWPACLNAALGRFWRTFEPNCGGSVQQSCLHRQKGCKVGSAHKVFWVTNTQQGHLLTLCIGTREKGVDSSHVCFSTYPYCRKFDV